VAVQRSFSLLAGIVLLALLAAPAAGAGEYDIQLRWLGSPGALPVSCQGANCTTAASGEAQKRFARLGSALGLAFVPRWSEPAASTGQAGVEVGVVETGVFLALSKEEWATEGSRGQSAAPGLLPITSVQVRKGLGGSLDLGLSVSYLPGSQILGLGAALRLAILDNLEHAPDVAIRVWGEHLVGSGELFVNEVGGDLLVSKTFGLAGVMKLQPFGQFGMAFVQLDTAKIDFQPESYNPVSPLSYQDVFERVLITDNRYLRASVGARLLTGVVVLALEGAAAWGTNPVQSAEPKTVEQFTRQYSLAANLGFGF
jgi:hypothetical protein